MVQQTPEDKYDEKTLADIETYGWHIVMIEDAEVLPAYAFSIGIYHTLGLPEICVFGIDNTDDVAQLINQVGELMRSGQQFHDGDISDEVLVDLPCKFRQVDKRYYRALFGYARWYHEGDDFPMLQCVWPDQEGNFPDQPNFDAELANAQPDLSVDEAWPFGNPKSQAVFTTRQVLEQDALITYVCHDEDGDWQFTCGTTNQTEDGQVVSLQQIVNQDPSVRQLADLPLGWEASRDSADDPWAIQKQ
ncbi:DUF4262 domain-containing protein [Bremerella cremea]|uniref:DUF4262 domain-containing protein n=1 Tax=Bremerella cremea TaxID=1031537 RepID=A0A368KNE5_9BACT|nr:DUF4262 domain-containing protein [Bremerella cremea]RCS44758.1 DUF4262 domain-containing protein [Bremerella cremea]